MSGNEPSRFLLDTNAIIQLLKGNPQISDLIKHADYLAISIISQLEFMGFSRISHEDQMLFSEFKARVEMIDLTASDVDLMSCIYALRAETSLKLPDAIIAASAKINDALLITADSKLLTQLGDKAQDFEVI
jgi:predicted nucleic acid-binding protein